MRLTEGFYLYQFCLGDGRKWPGDKEIGFIVGRNFQFYLKNYWLFCIFDAAAAAAAKSLQSCPTLCDPIDGRPWGSPIPGILQARTLEWVAISFSNAGKWKVKVKSLSPIRLFATPWTAAHQAPPSVGFSRQEYWSGVPLPSPVYLMTPNQITESFLFTYRIFTMAWKLPQIKQ